MVRVSMTSSLRFIVLAQAAAPWRTVETSTLIQRLAHQRVREREAVDLLGIVDDQPRRHRRLKRGEQVVGPELGRDVRSVASRKSVPSTVASVSVFNAAGASRSRRRPMTSLTPSGSPIAPAHREAVHQLLDEERVAAGLVEQPARQRDVGSFLADASRDECRRIRFVEASEVHIPIPVAISRRSTVDPDGDLWLSVLKSTGQPASWGPKGEPDPVTGAPMA